MTATTLFVSDNEAGVAPEILAALTNANSGLAPSYGDDPISRSLDTHFERLFGHPVRVFPVVSGTACNALALSAIAQPFGLMLCHRNSHAYANELGATESMAPGMRFLPVDGPCGKLQAAALDAELRRLGDGRGWQPVGLSLTQLTERGTCYQASEVMKLGAVARAHGMRVHMDGARFANAVAHLGCAPADIAWRAGVDVLSFGGTKNGTMGADAVVFFDAGLADGFGRRLKRSGHDLSKTRFLAAQLLASIQDGLWLRLATQANRMASALAQVLAATDGVALAEAVEGNMVFAWLESFVVARLDRCGIRLRQRSRDAEGRTLVRLVASFATTEGDIMRLKDALGECTG
jgi:threonine aldolase